MLTIWPYYNYWCILNGPGCGLVYHVLGLEAHVLGLGLGLGVLHQHEFLKLVLLCWLETQYTYRLKRFSCFFSVGGAGRVTNITVSSKLLNGCSRESFSSLANHPSLPYSTRCCGIWQDEKNISLKFASTQLESTQLQSIASRKANDIAPDVSGFFVFFWFENIVFGHLVYFRLATIRCHVTVEMPTAQVK